MKKPFNNCRAALAAFVLVTTTLNAGFSNSACDDNTYPYYTFTGSGSYAFNSGNFAYAFAQITEPSAQTPMSYFAAYYDSSNSPHVLIYGSGTGNVSSGYDLSYDSTECVRGAADVDVDVSTYVHCSAD